MRKRKLRLALAILLLALLGGLTWLLISSREPREPVYEGKSLGTWLQLYVESTDGTTLESRAEEAIRKIGTNGLPLYVRWLGKRNSALKEKIIYLTRKQTLVTVHYYTDDEHRTMARIGLGVLGPAAAPAVPALIDLLEKNEDVAVQGEVVMAFGRIGPAAGDAVPALIRCLNGTNRFASLFVPNTLAIIHEKPELVVPALIQHLDDSKRSPMDLHRTIDALGKFGDEAKSAFPAILPFLVSQDAKTRSAATNALKAIDPEAATKAGIK